MTPELMRADRHDALTGQTPAHGHSRTTEAARASFGNVAASYCPQLTLQTAQASKCVIAVPVAQLNGNTVVRAPLLGAYFGATSDSRAPSVQAEQYYRMLLTDAGIDEVYLAGYTKADDTDGIEAAVFLVPIAATPHLCIKSITELERWERNAHESASAPSTAWVSGMLLASSASGPVITKALARIRQLKEPAPESGLRIGIWQTARPLTHHRTSTHWKGLPVSKTSHEEFSRFISAEALRKPLIQQAFRQADSGNGRLIEWSGLVLVASDIIGDIVVPPQGLPSFRDPILETMMIPNRPLPIQSWMFARAPPQHVPDGGNEARSWTELIKPWARRMICSNFNMTAARDHETWSSGESAKPRPSFLILGSGAAHMQIHPDGPPFSWNAFDVIWERDSDGLYRPMDFQQLFKDHKLFAFIAEMFYDTKRDVEFTDHELVSFLLHGVRWKVDMPREIRVAHQLASLDSRYKGVSRSTKKLAAAGLFIATKLTRLRDGEEAQPFTPDGPSPLVYIPQASSPVGGADKKGTEEKRKVNAQTSPYVLPDGTRPKARNKPNGLPDGAEAISLNEMTKLPNPDGSPRFDKEVKSRVRDKYAAAAILYPQAHYWLNSFLSGFSDDIHAGSSFSSSSSPRNTGTQCPT